MGRKNYPGVPFGLTCRAVGLPMPEPEYRFHPTRRWRFDFAFLAARVAVEVQGGLFVNGRHSRGAALLKEHEKLNAAAALGWRVLFVTPKQIANGEALRTVEAALTGDAVDPVNRVTTDRPRATESPTSTPGETR